MKNIVLHIGTNKTGTSTLQDFLHSNRAQLKQYGFYYPDLSDICGSAHHAVSRILKGLSADEAGLPNTWFEDIVSRADDTKCDTVIFSSEDFHTIKDLALLKATFEGYEVKVILYLREYVAYLSSWYQQAIHSRNLTMSFDEFIEFHKSHYSSLLNKWAAAFGRDALVTSVYKRANLVGADITKDFISKLGGIDSNAIKNIGHDKNPSITGNLLFFKKVLNQFLTKEESLSVAYEIAAITKANPKYIGKMHISERDVSRINWLYESDVNYLKDEFNLALDVQTNVASGTPVPCQEALKEDWEQIVTYIKERPDWKLNDFVKRIPW